MKTAAGSKVHGRHGHLRPRRATEVATALAALTGEPHPLAITSSGAEGGNREEGRQS